MHTKIENMGKEVVVAILRQSRHYPVWTEENHDRMVVAPVDNGTGASGTVMRLVTAALTQRCLF
jgi:hypothetical protein